MRRPSCQKPSCWTEHAGEIQSCLLDPPFPAAADMYLIAGPVPCIMNSGLMWSAPRNSIAKRILVPPQGNEQITCCAADSRGAMVMPQATMEAAKAGVRNSADT